MNFTQVFFKVKNWFFQTSLTKKIIILSVIVIGGWFIFSRLSKPTKGQTSYQTSQVEKGTLIVAVTGSGQVSTANNTSVTTEATGVVSNLFVKDGDEVEAGDKIAEIDLDIIGQQKVAQALASYQGAKNSLESARASLYSLQSDMFTQWKEHYDLATNSTYQNSDGVPNESNRALAQFHISEDDWLASEAKYKNQQNVVTQAQTSLSASWFAYKQSSSIIYAPISGTVSGLSLQIGSVIASSQSDTQSTSKIASIKTKALPTVTINLTEIDVPKIKIDDKATVIFDALPDKTYTGKVISIDKTGMVNSGVTTYPTMIKLDIESNDILPNMAASANIITATKDNVLLVPASSIQNQDDETYVRVMKNGELQEVAVEVGLSSDTQAEIISGLLEGDTVVTGIIQSATGGQSSQSPFSSFGGNAFRMTGSGARTGNAVRIMR
jgi:HlyD family secretion protein